MYSLHDHRLSCYMYHIGVRFSRPPAPISCYCIVLCAGAPQSALVLPLPHTRRAKKWLIHVRWPASQTSLPMDTALYSVVCASLCDFAFSTRDSVVIIRNQWRMGLPPYGVMFMFESFGVGKLQTQCAPNADAPPQKSRMLKDR